jgi:hypothetical protein
MLALFAVAGALPLQQLQFETPLAHVEAAINLPGVYAGVPSVLRWWCGDKAHAAGPLCVRHEIALQMAQASGAERRSNHAQRQSLLGDSAMRELKYALSAYCDQSQNATGATNISARGVCAELASGRTPTHSGPPQRAVQLVEMNQWWCAPPGRNESLGCRRHALQMEHQLAATATEREAVRARLESLLASATPAEMESLREDMHAMQSSYCAGTEHATLEICNGENKEHAGAAGGRSRPGSWISGRPGRGQAGGMRRGRGRGGNRRPKPQWSTKEAFGSLKEWWCHGPIPHPNDSRCEQGIEWSRKVAQGVRYVFCNEPNASFAAALQLCDAAPGGERSQQRGPSGADKTRMRRPGSLRLTGVCILMAAILLAAVVCGWNLKRQVGKPFEHVGEPVRAVAIGTSRANMRSRLGRRLQVVHEVPVVTATGAAVSGGVPLV